MGRRASLPGASAASCARLLESVSRSVRAGLSLSAALIDAVSDEPSAPSAAAPRPVIDAVDERILDAVRRHRRGLPLAECLRVARERCDDDGPVRLTVTVLLVAAGHGGPSAEALDRAATTLRERAALAADAQVHAAPARLSATMLGWAPVAFSSVAAMLDHRVRHVLIGTPAGWLCIAGGTALALAGRRWMSRLVGVDP